MQKATEKLLSSVEPSIRLRTHVEILGDSSDSAALADLQEQVRRSKRVRLLLSERKAGKIPYHPYAKWYGAHWVLSALADLRYPPEDRTLIPLREQVYGWLFSKQHLQYTRHHETFAAAPTKVRGRVRAHASIEGNAIHYLHALGIADERTRTLADRLVEWQWPDGGWNCDRNLGAHTSSFTESLLPLRGLVHYAESGGSAYRVAVQKAAAFFLERRLYKRKRDGKVVSGKFMKLHYPCYWHYDFLFGLKVMMETGLIHDRGCLDAIGLLRERRLKDGGFPAEEAYYRVATGLSSGRSLVSWGGVSTKRMNEFVTCDAIQVLTAADAV